MSESQLNELLYVAAKTKRDAMCFARKNGFYPNKVRFVYKEHHLRGIDGAGKDIFILKGAEDRLNAEEIIANAIAGKFNVVNV